MLLFRQRLTFGICMFPFRYIICKWLKEDTKDISDYMYEINDALAKYRGTANDKDITDIVPLNLLKENEEFYDYIVESNNK